MIFIPSLSMWEYLDKFGKTVSVVEWIVYLNNCLLASETSLFQTICEMTDYSHLLKNNMWKVTMHWAPSLWNSKTDQPIPHLKWFQHGPLFHKLKWKIVHAERGFLFVALQTNIFHLTGRHGWKMMWCILFQWSQWEVLYRSVFKGLFQRMSEYEVIHSNHRTHT